MATKKNTSKGRKAAPKLSASTADKHVLYQKSVQAPEVELAFFDRVFRKVRGRKPLRLREDFCGTALLCARWVESHPERVATGIDIDKKVLRWGARHNVEPLGDAAERVTLLEQNVLVPAPGRHDVVCAFNFSYWIFRTREQMRDYFRVVKRALGPDGLFFLDAYGGWESQEPMEERRRVKGGFYYIWDQARFDPINHVAKNYIHFEFQDGTRLDKAFAYEWRFWSLPELRELLAEAGFGKVEVHWDCSDDEDVESYRPRLRAENQPGWLAYIVASVQ